MTAALWCLASCLIQAGETHNLQGFGKDLPTVTAYTPVTMPLVAMHQPAGCPRLLCAAGELQWMCYDMLSNRNEWWVPGKLVDIRQRLEPYWRVSRLLQSKSTVLLQCLTPLAYTECLLGCQLQCFICIPALLLQWVSCYAGCCSASQAASLLPQWLPDVLVGISASPSTSQ